MVPQKIVDTLSKYMPAAAAPLVAKLLVKHHVQFTVAQSRKTKFGDYRHPYGKDGHRISVNGTLNTYAFLITTLHELAHLTTWEKHQNKVKPHGPEWQREFRELAKPFLALQLFPEHLATAFKSYLQAPTASSASHSELFKAILLCDKNHENKLVLDDLDYGCYFTTEDGRVFRKEELIRKNYLCTELASGKKYRVSPLMRVKPVSLTAALEKPQKPDNSSAATYLQNLPLRSHFQCPQGQIYQVVSHMPTSSLCQEAQSGQIFQLDVGMMVTPVQVESPPEEPKHASAREAKYEKTLLLEQLPLGTVFSIHTGEHFTLVRKLRKHFLCEALDTGKQYRISAYMPVAVPQHFNTSKG